MTRLLILEVPDTQTQDDIQMAIAIWNEQGAPSTERRIQVLQQTSIIVGDS